MPGAGARTGFTPEADATAASWYGWGQHTLACWWPGAAVRSKGYSGQGGRRARRRRGTDGGRGWRRYAEAQNLALVVARRTSLLGIVSAAVRLGGAVPGTAEPGLC